MDRQHLQELIDVERTYWWHVSKRALVLQTLQRFCPPPGRVVEGGVGGGLMLRAVQDAGYRVSGYDIYPESVAHCRALGVTDVSVHDLEQPWPLEPRSARAVLLLDVLEHLDHPDAVLRDAAGGLEDGGALVLTVPAYPALLGPWDRMLGHKRRYTMDILRQTAADAGLTVRWMSHWNAFSLPPALLVRTAQRLGGSGSGAEFPKVPSLVNLGLRSLARAERAVLRRTPIPAGLSIVAVLQPA